MHNVKLEKDLYPAMVKWLLQYLKDRYPNAEIYSIDTSELTLDKVLMQYNVIDEYPQAVGLDIQIDVLGLVKENHRTKLFFIEAKKTKLTIQHLGQLIVYCKLIGPQDAFLLSSAGMGSLSKILVNLNREDLLYYSYYKIDGNLLCVDTNSKIHVGAWDVDRNEPIRETMVPIY